jgi:diguanylate cyclase (GGDEF)-like protein
MIYNALGHLFGDNQLNKKSYQYLLSAFQQWAQVNDYQDMFNMLHSLNSRAISNLRFDLAQQHVDEMFALAKQQPDFNDFTFFSYYNAALLADNTKDFTFAIKQYQQALTLKSTTQENYFIRASYESLAIIYLRTNQLPLAKEILEEYQQKYPNAKYIKKEMLALEAKVKGNVFESERVLFNVIDEQIKQRREFTHFAVQATASLHNEKISELDVRVLEQDLSISQLKLANTLQDKKSIQSTLVFTALFIVSLLLFIGYLLKLHRKVKRYARTDGLTGIANRRFILELGQRMLRKVKATQPLTILLFDIDNFKQINDGQGHHVGDNAIKLIVNTTSSNLRKQDHLGRIGGDEFLALLPETTKEEAHIIAERIRKSVEQATQHCFEGLSAQVSVSIGVVSADNNEQLQAMIIRADDALYRAKGLGRNVVVVG